jgi:holliday junction DNA helicase RuvA
MISYLIGKPLLEKDLVTILVGGVGYAVRVTDGCRVDLASQNEAELYIYTHVREEALELYGFGNINDRELFLLLLGVSGVGPKTALQIVNLGATKIIDGVQQANTHLFSSVPRVGKKLAQKIIIDLRAKLGSLKELDIGPLSPQREEVTLALQSLGFADEIIQNVLEQIDVEAVTTAEAVKQAIKLAGQKK